MSAENWENLPIYKLLCRKPVQEFSVKTSLDLHNQRVIKCDVDRTKSEEFNSNERDLLEILLTLYCKETGTSYKQGMNEVLAPFLLLYRRGMPLYIVYSCYKQFINSCLRTMFEDDVIFYLDF